MAMSSAHRVDAKEQMSVADQDMHCWRYREMHSLVIDRGPPLPMQATSCCWCPRPIGCLNNQRSGPRKEALIDDLNTDTLSSIALVGVVDGSSLMGIEDGLLQVFGAFNIGSWISKSSSISESIEKIVPPISKDRTRDLSVPLGLDLPQPCP